MVKRAKSKPDFALEARAGGRVAGIDEAGRGPLAGPVVAAAVILDPARIPDGLDDSKRLSRNQRERARRALLEVAEVGVGQASVEEIDLHNILNATLMAMARAVANLPTPPDFALVDGNKLPVLPCPAEALIGGDGRSLSIAAASIVAKVARDELMAELAAKHPGYGWDRNAGYPTAEHRAALEELGATEHHRLSFAPVRKLMTQESTPTA